MYMTKGRAQKSSAQVILKPGVFCNLKIYKPRHINNVKWIKKPVELMQKGIVLFFPLELMKDDYNEVKINGSK